MMTKSIVPTRVPSKWFTVAGWTAIIIGGLLAAGFAHNPSRFMMWASAYLVLVAGAAQVAFGVFLQDNVKPHSYRRLWMAVTLYNLSGAGIVFGVLLKASITGSSILVLGEALLLLALVLIVLAVRDARRNAKLTGLYLLSVLLFVSMFVGFFLSIHINF